MKIMKIRIIAASLAVALILPIAAQAGSNCGVSQGYGTSNPHTFNRSTCGFSDNSYSVPDSARQSEVLIPSGAQKNKPVGYGTNNPYIPNSGADKLGSNTSGS
jgi:hypothetical protein